MKLFPAKISEQAASIAKSMTSEANGALLTAKVDLRPPLQRGVMNFQLYNKSLKDWSLGKQNIAKSMTSISNSALLTANVDRRPPLQRLSLNLQL